MLGSGFVKFVMPILKRGVIPLQILYPSSVSWKITPLYFFSSKNIYFSHKKPIKIKIFKTFECLGQNLSNLLCLFWNDKLTPLRILYPLQFHERLFVSTFLTQRIHTLLKRNPLKWKFLTLLSTRVKFCEIIYANFETWSDCSAHFLSLFSFMKDYSSLFF